MKETPVTVGPPELAELPSPAAVEPGESRRRGRGRRGRTAHAGRAAQQGARLRAAGAFKLKALQRGGGSVQSRRRRGGSAGGGEGGFGFERRTRAGWARSHRWRSALLWQWGCDRDSRSLPHKRRHSDGCLRSQAAELPDAVASTNMTVYPRSRVARGQGRSWECVITNSGGIVTWVRLRRLEVGALQRAPRSSDWFFRFNLRSPGGDGFIAWAFEWLTGSVLGRSPSAGSGGGRLTVVPMASGSCTHGVAGVCENCPAPTEHTYLKEPSSRIQAHSRPDDHVTRRTASPGGVPLREPRTLRSVGSESNADLTGVDSQGEQVLVEVADAPWSRQHPVLQAAERTLPSLRL